MQSARLKLAVAAVAGVAAIIGCATTGGGGGMAAKTAEGIPLGSAGPNAVQPLPDRPRFGKPISEADVAAWNIDVRTSDGLGLPPGRGSVAEGAKIYAAKCVACHGADAKGGPVYGTMVGGIGSNPADPQPYSDETVGMQQAIKNAYLTPEWQDIEIDLTTVVPTTPFHMISGFCWTVNYQPGVPTPQSPPTVIYLDDIVWDTE